MRRYPYPFYWPVYFQFISSPLSSNSESSGYSFLLRLLSTLCKSISLFFPDDLLVTMCCVSVLYHNQSYCFLIDVHVWMPHHTNRKYCNVDYVAFHPTLLLLHYAIIARVCINYKNYTGFHWK